MYHILTSLTVLACLAVAPIGVGAADFTVENGSLSVRYAEATSAFDLTEKASV